MSPYDLLFCGNYGCNLTEIKDAKHPNFCELFFLDLCSLVSSFIYTVSFAIDTVGADGRCRWSQ